MIDNGGSGRERARLAIEAATQYYLHGVSMHEIGARLSVSRSTVSRLIGHARDQGWVHIEVRRPRDVLTAAETRLAERARLQYVGSVPTSAPVETLAAAAAAAASFLSSVVTDGASVAVAWGTTTEAISRAMRPSSRLVGTVVQLNGAGSVNDAGGSFAVEIVSELARSFNARPEYFSVPAFFDDATTRVALWNERSIARVVQAQTAADVALFSVGSTRADVPSHVHTAGYLSPADLAQLERDGVVGDIATVFYRSDGTSAGVELNSRSSGPPLDTLRAIPSRVCVAVGVGKAEALAASLRGGFVTHLIADDELLERTERLLAAPLVR